jgi:hypothetical protein
MCRARKVSRRSLGDPDDLAWPCWSGPRRRRRSSTWAASRSQSTGVRVPSTAMSSRPSRSRRNRPPGPGPPPLDGLADQVLAPVLVGGLQPHHPYVGCSRAVSRSRLRAGASSGELAEDHGNVPPARSPGGGWVGCAPLGFGVPSLRSAPVVPVQVGAGPSAVALVSSSVLPVRVASQDGWVAGLGGRTGVAVSRLFNGRGGVRLTRRLSINPAPVAESRSTPSGIRRQQPNTRTRGRGRRLACMPIGARQVSVGSARRSRSTKPARQWPAAPTLNEIRARSQPPTGGRCLVAQFRLSRCPLQHPSGDGNRHRDERKLPRSPLHGH